MGFCQQLENQTRLESNSNITQLNINYNSIEKEILIMTPKQVNENNLVNTTNFDNIPESCCKSDNKDEGSDKSFANDKGDEENKKVADKLQSLTIEDTEKGQQESKEKDATEMNVVSKHSVEDFHFLGDLGKGAFGDVHLVRKKKGSDLGQHYALKMIYKNKIKEDEHYSTHFESERAALQKVRANNFLSTLYYAFQSETNLYLVMDYNPGGQLLQQFVGGQSIVEREMKFYLCELLVAVDFLHKLNIIHRDIKPENILLDHTGHIVLIDYGLSKLTGSDKNNSYVGTEPYIAPEIIKHQKHDRMVDFWSVGVLGFEMVKGEPPFSLRNTDENMRTAVVKQTVQYPKYFSRLCVTLLKGLLQKNPAVRFGCYNNEGVGGMQAVMDHKFFKGIKWDHVRDRKLRTPAKLEPKNLSKMKPRPFKEPVDDTGFRMQFPGYDYCYSDVQEETKL